MGDPVLSGIALGGIFIGLWKFGAWMADVGPTTSDLSQGKIDPYPRSTWKTDPPKERSICK